MHKMAPNDRLADGVRRIREVANARISRTRTIPGILQPIIDAVIRTHLPCGGEIGLAQSGSGPVELRRTFSRAPAGTTMIENGIYLAHPEACAC